MRHWWRYIRRESAVLAVFAVAGLLAFGMVAPASAQLFDFGFGNRRPMPPREVPRGGGGGFFPGFRDGGFFGDPAPARTVLVLGDAMADWLAYGLEDALSETPELGVVRKAKTVSGLIRYQPKGEPSDWAAAAKCSRARISRARCAACVLTTASISPRPVRASSPITPSVKSAACWPRG